MCRLLKPLFERVECEQGRAFTYLGDDWLLPVDRCSKASQFLSRTKSTIKTCSKNSWEGLKIVSNADALSTSFPGSLSSASFGHWKKDPGCGWSRDHLWHTLLYGVESTNIFCPSQMKRKKGDRWSSLYLTTPRRIHFWNSQFLFYAWHRSNEIFLR